MFQLGFLKKKDIFLDLKPTDKVDVIRQMVNKLNVNNKTKILEALLEREKLGTTAIGKGVAIPHVRNNLIKEVIVKVAFFKKGIDFEALDNKDVNFLFLILAPERGHPHYIKILAYISKIMNKNQTREALLEARTKEEILKVLKCGY